MATSTFEDKIKSVEGWLDRTLPSVSNPCSIMACTPGKIWGVLAVLSILGSMTSWSNLVSTVLWEAVIGLLIVWLCRTCRSVWVWIGLLLGGGLPILIFAAIFISSAKSA